MRSERSDSLSSNSSLESVDSAYRTISNPGTPRMHAESRSPVPPQERSCSSSSLSALNVPALKTALSTPPLNQQQLPSTCSSPDPVCMMPPKFRMKQSLSGSSSPDSKGTSRRPASAEAAPPQRMMMPPHPFLLYNQYAAAAAFHQHMMMVQQQHPDLMEHRR